MAQKGARRLVIPTFFPWWSQSNHYGIETEGVKKFYTRYGYVAIEPYGIETGIVGVSLYKTKDTPKPSLPPKVA
jgi:hypothetical protein